MTTVKPKRGHNERNKVNGSKNEYFASTTPNPLMINRINKVSIA